MEDPERQKSRQAAEAQARKRSRSSGDGSSSSSSSNGRSSHSGSGGSKSNHLRRESEFICKMKFSNNLPPIPFDPKLLTNPFDPMRFVKYRTTSLETSHQHMLHVEPDLGIPIDLIDHSTYMPVPGLQLAPEDAALLQTTTGETPEAKRKAKAVREKPTTPVSWLRRHTEYISNDYEGPTVKKRSRVDVSIEARTGHASQKLQEAQGAKRKRTQEEIMDAIERGFERAKEVPVHPTDPSLKAVEILPVFPDFDLWPNSYTLVTFDHDPGRPQHQKRALLKGFSTEAVPEVGLEKQSFVAYLMPSDSGDEKGKGKKKVDEEEGEEEVKEVPGKTEEYDWVREYVFRKDPQHSATYFFVWDEETGTVRYNEVHTKIVLDKIKSQAVKDAIRRQARPAHSYVTTREPDEDETAAMEQAREALQPPY